jgi:hypothetical protein
MLAWLILSWVIQVEWDLAAAATTSAAVNAHTTTACLHVYTVLYSTLSISHIERWNAEIASLNGGSDDFTVGFGDDLLVAAALAVTTRTSHWALVSSELRVIIPSGIWPAHVHGEWADGSAEESHAASGLLQCVQVLVLFVVSVGDVELNFIFVWNNVSVRDKLMCVCVCF